jgi:multiple sugar transport system substrate-binding protein
MRFFSLIIVFFLVGSCRQGEEELTFWIGGSPDEINFWQEIIDSYEEQSGTQVTMVRQPTYTDQRRQSLVVSLVAEQPNPDVFLMDVVWLKQFAQSGWLEPLEEHISRTAFPIDPFYERVLNLTDRYNGILYALPVFVDIGLFYYRTDLLEQYGFPGTADT